MDLRILVLNFNFAMICYHHKISVLIKNDMNHLKDNILKFFYRKYNRLLFFKN